MNKNDDDDFETRKSSTMNSMYIGSTINKPCVESIINAVATILHSQMLEVSVKLIVIVCRIKTKERKSRKTVNYFSFQRKSIFLRNQMLLIAKELLCWEKHQLLKIFLNLSRHFMTVPSSVQSAASYLWFMSIDSLLLLRCHCNLLIGGLSCCVPFLSPRKYGTTGTWLTRILLLSILFLSLKKSTSLSRSS